MRLIKVNDIILNMDNIVVIKGSKLGEDYSGGVDVYAYSADQRIYLGHCDSQEDYQQWIDALYEEFNDRFLNKVIITNDEDEELWK